MTADGPDPREVLAELDDLEAAVDEVTLWHASIELDGEAATIRRAIETALGDGPPVYVELGAGHVLELDPHNPDIEQEPRR